MSEPMLDAAGVCVRFGGLKALDDVSLRVRAGAVHGLIGPNGAGKTTLFNVISGLAETAAGGIRLDGVSIEGSPSWARSRRGLARTFQNIRMFGEMTALENVMTGMHVRLAEPLHSIIARSRAFRSAERAAARRAEDYLSFVGLPEMGRRRGGALSYGDQRRLEIARALASEPRLLMLDEPAAGMNPSEKKGLSELIRRIQARGVTILLVEHDMQFVMSLCESITVLNFGRVIADGSPEAVRGDRRVIEAYLGSNASQGGAGEAPQ